MKVLILSIIICIFAFKSMIRKFLMQEKIYLSSKNKKLGVFDLAA